LISLVLAAAIPVLLFGGWVAYVTADGERTAARRAAFDTTVRVADRVQADLAAQVQVLNALGVALALEEADLPRFYAEAQRLKAVQPLWETVELSDTAGTQVLNLLRPFGAPLGPTADRDSFDEVIRTLRPVVGGIGPVGAISGKRLVSLRVPVLQGGQLRFVLTVALATNAVSSILREAGAPKDWVGAIVDRRGNIIARTVAEEAEIGRPASPTLRDAFARAPEGFFVGPTLEGVQTETVYRTLADTGGWSVHFGVPTAVLDAPVSRSWYLLMAGALASLLVAGALAALTSRDIAQRRRDEEVRMALALKVSEERGSVAVEAADLGTLRWDAGRDEITGSARSRALLGLPRSTSDGDESDWPASEFLAAVHPDDRARLTEAVRRCLAEDEPLDVEFRVTRAGSRPHWVRITGRASRLDEEKESATMIHGVVADIEPHKRAEAERLDLLRRLSEAQENEQRRIARELHDQVGQTVTGLSIGLKGLERMLGTGQTGGEAREHLRWLLSLAAEIGRDIHRAALDLRPTALDDLGLYKALGAYTAEWSRHHGVPVDLQVLGDERRLPAEIETAAYRIVQEALTNVLKHAAARTVSVLLERRADALRLIVEDDGKGFEPEANGLDRPHSDGRPRLGLSGIRERLALVGGTMTLESASGSGTALFVQIPLLSGEAPP
jgi:two-component system, NarL family, sensor histidine kinase UhpB